MTTFQTLINELPNEILRVKAMTNTLQGLQKIISIYEKHFNIKYTHGVNVVYEVARVNILKRLKNEPIIC